MRATLFCSAVSLAALAVTEPAVAADESAAETVVVSATRTPIPEQQVASTVTVITADDIAARQEQTLPDVLKDVPGINVVQNGGAGALTTLFMRGTNPNHVKVLVDGIDISDPSSPSDTFDFGQFLTQDIERVEVLRGPQSGLYGSDAIGGVINIITRSGSGPAKIRASVEGGSFDTFNQSAGLSGSTDGLHYTANLEHLHSGATPVTPLDLLPPGEARNDDYYDNLTASTKLSYDITQAVDVGLVARYADTHYRFTGDTFDPVTFIGYPAPEQSASNTAEYFARIWAHAIVLDGLLEQTLGVAYTRNRTANLAPDTPASLATGERVKVDWQGSVKVNATETVLLGAEHEHEEISQPLSAGTRITSGYAELQSQLVPNLFSTLNVRYDDNDRFGSKTTYRVAPVYVIEATGTRLKASLGTGFKAPTLSELYQDFPPFFFSNPNLRPETSVGYDVGVEQGVAADAIRGGVTYFHNRIRNLITTDLTGTTYANVGRATTSGVESFVSYRPVKSLTLLANYTFTEATDDVLDEELLRRPRHKVSFNADWRVVPPMGLDLTVLTVGPWIDGNRDFTIPRLEAPGYTTVNLAVSYDVTKSLTAYARGTNLFDRHFQNPIGYLQPGIGGFVGLRVNL